MITRTTAPVIMPATYMQYRARFDNSHTHPFLRFPRNRNIPLLYYEFNTIIRDVSVSVNAFLSPALPVCSSIRRRRLYFATRSERQGAPVLIRPALNATSNIRNKGILSLPGTVGNDGPVTCILSGLYRLEGFSEGCRSDSP